MLYVDASEFRRLRDDARRFDTKLLTGLRRAIKAVGQIGMDAVEKELDKAPPNDQPGSVGSRDAVKAGLRTVISFSARTAGVRIVATNARLDPAHRGFVAAYESKGLRHPVYGNDRVWVDQPTRPYFGAAIHDALEGRGQELVMKAVDDAVRAIGGRGK